MDPLTTAIIGAVSKLADQSVSDIYHAIKSALRKKYGSDSRLIQAVDAVEAHPVAKQPAERLHQEVLASGAFTLPEVSALAEELMLSMGKSDAGPQVSQVTIGNRNLVVGINHGSIE